MIQKLSNIRIGSDAILNRIGIVDWIRIVDALESFQIKLDISLFAISGFVRIEICDGRSVR
ncbi:hypothetical protein BpHYR1_012885 [Brachionus plicatilis]|uniref:Uncharacterized protein n=1 Tax=Brachionus plicatilis TaxID=10195 RepID=A0A3M7QFJ3_BRAPC|nr:hypothetical protein BpHYR1_012885 [Brachionus plicatilis]